MEHHLKTPVPEKIIRKLKVGDLIYVTGIIITARDEAHLKALELYEEGLQLAQSCSQTLRSAELKLKKISKSAGKQFELTDFEEQE